MDRLYLLERIGAFLRERPGFICPGDVREVMGSAGVSAEFAWTSLLFAACGLDAARERALFAQALDAVCLLDGREYAENPYYRNIRLARAAEGSFRLGYEQYAACEAVVCGELREGRDGTLLPRLGFFMEGFRYPALMEGDTLWMSVTPNEVETMKAPIDRARGKTLTLGLGMGYYAYMIAQKDDVDSVTAVEREAEVIRLFQRHILPQFPNREKIRVVQADAFEYVREQAGREGFDHAFCDLWHDAGDGIPMYRRMKALEASAGIARWDYWIEPTMRMYMEAGVGEEETR